MPGWETAKTLEPPKVNSFPVGQAEASGVFDANLTAIMEPAL